MLVTAFECSVNLVKSREGNTNSHTISSSVVCCVWRAGFIGISGLAIVLEAIGRFPIAPLLFKVT